VARVISGIQPVREAIRTRGGELEKVLILEEPSPQLEALGRFARDQGVGVERASRGDLDRLAKGARHQGAIAFAPELSLVRIEDLELGPDALVVALDELQDPQNFGAVLRSSVAMGATAVLWPEHASAPLTAATFRASAGAVEHAVLCRVTALPAALETLRAAGLSVLGLDMQGSVNVDDLDLTGPLVWVVGAEGKGLRRGVKASCTQLVKLPMRGPIASLNASVAAAIALYETARQRGRDETARQRGRDETARQRATKSRDA
jgi:23S rRNA (guanosine2251-2'-O)-methyltransferase